MRQIKGFAFISVHMNLLLLRYRCPDRLPNLELNGMVR